MVLKSSKLAKQYHSLRIAVDDNYVLFGSGSELVPTPVSEYGEELYPPMEDGFFNFSKHEFQTKSEIIDGGIISEDVYEERQYLRGSTILRMSASSILRLTLSGNRLSGQEPVVGAAFYYISPSYTYSYVDYIAIGDYTAIIKVPSNANALRFFTASFGNEFSYAKKNDTSGDSSSTDEKVIVIPGNEINTWDDWHLIPTSRPVVNPPEVRFKHVEIPGMDGMLDLTTYIGGKPSYGNRTGSWEFIVHHDYSSWESIYSEIMQFLHGFNCTVILDDDPGYRYTGRLSVNQFKSDKNWSTITIDYNLQPFKEEITSSIEQWEWDPFNFYNGVIRNYKDMSINGTKNLEIKNGAGQVELLVKYNGPNTDSQVQLVLNSNEFLLNNTSDEYYNTGMYLLNGVNTLTIKGTGTISINVRGRWL